MGEVNDTDFNLSGWGEEKRLLEGTCGHCQRTVVFKDPEGGITCLHFEQTIPIEDEGYEVADHFFVMGICPNPRCQDATIVYRVEAHMRNQGWTDERRLVRQEVVHPVGSARRILMEEVPKQIRALYEEAGKVEFLSPNSAAFIARRILEQTLKAELASKQRLVDLIDSFLHKSGIPEELHRLMHDVRGFGNIAGHPSRGGDGEWIDVDQVEASYILDVVHELLDFVYVRPVRQRAMRDRLEAKRRGQRPTNPFPGDIVIAGMPEQARKPDPSGDEDLPF